MTFSLRSTARLLAGLSALSTPTVASLLGRRTAKMQHSRLLLAVCAVAVSSVAGTAKADTIGFLQTNLVSDGSVPAAITDPGFLNPWGLTENRGSPFWVSVNGSGLSNIYAVPGGGGAPVSQNSLTVTIPAASGVPFDTSAPTGVVFNGTRSNSTPGFKLSNGSPAIFLFDSEDGAVTGWNGGTAAVLTPVNNFGSAVYKGLAIYNGLAIDSSDARLFAANFNSGEIEMYDSSFGLVKSFTDPNIPKGYAPFNLSVINGKLYVTFAKQDAAKHDDELGPGHGFVDVFDLDGGNAMRLISRGELNSPWGLQIAPPTFGTLSGDLLVGNFGDGRINAYDPTTGAFESTLLGADGRPLSITDLWALAIGNGGPGGDPNTLYFTAGLKDEKHGLFGSLSPEPVTAVVPELSTWAMMTLGFAGLALVGYRRARHSRLGLTAC